MDKKLTLLLIDESSALRTAIVPALEAQGCRVHSAGTPAEARALLAEAKADVVSLEMMLKDDNSFAFEEENKALTDMGWQSVKVGTKMSLVFDVVSTEAYINGMSLALTPKEFSLLFLLTRYKGKALSSEYLYEEVWKMPMNEDNGAVRQHISRLNKKLDEASNGRFTISSTRDAGYSLEYEETE